MKTVNLYLDNWFPIYAASRVFAPETFISLFRSPVRAPAEDHDAEHHPSHQSPRQVLDPEALPLPLPQGLPPRLRQGVRLPVRVRAVQVAALAQPAEGEAANHLGIQGEQARI